MAAIEVVTRSLPIGRDSTWRVELDARLRDGTDTAVQVGEPVDCFCPALGGEGSLAIRGSLGDSALCDFHAAAATVHGDVGYAAAVSIRAGVLKIRGAAGAMLAAGGVGGTVLVGGRVGDCCGANLRGGDVCVVGGAGAEAGLGMQDGALVILDGAGRDLGRRMRGGTIFLAGDCEAVSQDVASVRMREPDRLRLSLILLNCNVTAKPKDFRVYRPV